MSCWTRILWCTVSNLKDCETQSSTFLISVWVCWPICLPEWDQRTDTQKAVDEAKRVSWSEKSWILTSRSDKSISSACCSSQTISVIKLSGLNRLRFMGYKATFSQVLNLRTNLRDLYLSLSFFFFVIFATSNCYLPQYIFNSFSYFAHSE